MAATGLGPGLLRGAGRIDSTTGGRRPIASLAFLRPSRHNRSHDEVLPDLPRSEAAPHFLSATFHPVLPPVRPHIGKSAGYRLQGHHRGGRPRCAEHRPPGPQQAGTSTRRLLHRRYLRAPGTHRRQAAASPIEPRSRVPVIHLPGHEATYLQLAVGSALVEGVAAGARRPQGTSAVLRQGPPRPRAVPQAFPQGQGLPPQRRPPLPRAARSTLPRGRQLASGAGPGSPWRRASSRPCRPSSPAASSTLP